MPLASFIFFLSFLRSPNDDGNRSEGPLKKEITRRFKADRAFQNGIVRWYREVNLQIRSSFTMALLAHARPDLVHVKDVDVSRPDLPSSRLATCLKSARRRFPSFLSIFCVRNSKKRFRATFWGQATKKSSLNLNTVDSRVWGLLIFSLLYMRCEKAKPFCDTLLYYILNYSRETFNIQDCKSGLSSKSSLESVAPAKKQSRYTWTKWERL